MPRKNIKELKGKPLLFHTIDQANQSILVSKIIVSTDCSIIASWASWYNTKVVMRPAELAQDDTPVADAVIFTIEQEEQSVDNVVILQPTSPLRTSNDIDACILMFFEKKADSVISFTKETHPIEWHKRILNDGRLMTIMGKETYQRQDYCESYYPNGAVYVFKYDLIKRKEYYTDRTYAYIMPADRSVDIDTIDDFEYAEYLMEKKANEIR